jgi:uncharacterized membrane protein YecN with MAPEG domain
MAGYQVGSLLIIVLGIAIIVASVPAPRLAMRNHSIGEQIGMPMIRWFTRVFGILTCILGIVTLLHG